MYSLMQDRIIQVDKEEFDKFFTVAIGVFKDTNWTRVEEVAKAWGADRAKTESNREQEHALYVNKSSDAWCVQRESGDQSHDALVKRLRDSTYRAKVDALGRLRIRLPSFISRYKLNQFAFVRGANSKQSKDHPAEDNSSSATTGQYDQFTASASGSSSSESKAGSEPSSSKTQAKPSSNKPRYFLDLPMLCIEYKKVDQDRRTGTNQLRMYLIAAVKFLAAIGITEYPVFGVQSDGPRVVVSAIQARAVRSLFA